ncbi:MAG: peptidoglycan editing factor PgeF [Candidatus Thioglobus sp.]|nr:MAG: peptidoglycan editing factor PgeF [Candidatus Thioglobus sp.]
MTKHSNFPSNVRLLSTKRYLASAAGVGNYDNFNLATHTGDNLDVVLHNRQLLARHFNLPNMPKWLNQTHSNICLEASAKSCEGDAIITKNSKTVCAIMTADCLPIFATNTQGLQVGVAHAGWQGILNGVIESFIAAFDESELLVHFGPAISAKNLEVGSEVFEQFVDKDQKLSAALTQKGEKYHLDIYQAARIILGNLGVNSITGGDECTFAQSQDYFSYRRDGAKSGRMAHLIWIDI